MDRRAVSMPAMIAGAVLLACAAALLAAPQEAEAAFPGQNGRIAFVSERTTGESVDNPEGDEEIFTINPDGTELTQLTHNATNDGDPAWSPDGTAVAYMGHNTRLIGSAYGEELFTVPASGGGTPVRLTYTRYDTSTATTTPLHKYAPTWSEDGTEVFYTGVLYDSRTGRSTYRVYSVPAGGGEPVHRPDVSAYEPQDSPPYYEGGAVTGGWSWSPDRSSVAYADIDDDHPQYDWGFSNEIFVRPAGADASAGVQITDNPKYDGSHNLGPAWSPEGSEIAFLGMRDDGNDNGVYIMGAGGGTPVRVPNSQASGWTSVDWGSRSPDTTAPTVEGVSPKARSGGARRGADVRASFSEEMRPSTVRSGTFGLVEARTGRRVAASVVCPSPCTRAELDPSARLAANTRYRATVTMGAEDLAGNALDQRAGEEGDQPKAWSFTTGD